MSTYEYNNGDRRFSADTALNGQCVYVTAQPTSTPLNGMWIPNTDVPTVAAELLKAAGQEATILPKTIADVQEFANGQFTCGWVTLTGEKTQTWMREVAANYIAIADYVEGKASREAVAEKKLQERRDALAKRFTKDVNGDYIDYKTCGPYTRKAIDAYVELEDGK